MNSSSYDPFDKPKRDSMSGELADTGVRFVALVIDSFVLGLITAGLFAEARNAGGIAGFVVGIVYQWYFLTRNNGQTPGKRMMGIRVIKVSGAPLDSADVIVRYIGYFIDSFFFGIGWLWALMDRNKQCWHDKLAGTFVVRA